MELTSPNNNNSNDNDNSTSIDPSNERKGSRITHNFELAPLASGSDPGAFGETSVLISMVQGPSSYESSTLKVWQARAGIRTIG
jgi:hypothetical protein